MPEDGKGLEKMNGFNLEDKLTTVMDIAELAPLIIATRFGPWLTPLVPAYFVHRAMIARLETPIFWAWVAAIALEFVGIAAMYSLLRSYQWNREKRKNDPEAPLIWNIIAVIVYFATAFLLVLFVELFPESTKFAPAAFIILAGTSASVIVLVGDQKRREREVRLQKATQKRTQSDDMTRHNSGHVSRSSRKMSLQEAQEIIEDNPDISGADLGRVLDLSPRQGQRLLKRISNSSSNGKV